MAPLDMTSKSMHTGTHTHVSTSWDSRSVCAYAASAVTWQELCNSKEAFTAGAPTVCKILCEALDSGFIG